MDPPSSGFRRHSALGWSSGGRPDGFSCQPPPAPFGVSLSSPGRSGGGLLKYRLEWLRVLLSVSSSSHASATFAPYPLVQVAKGRRGSVAPARPVVSSVATEGGRPPPPAGDSLSADGRGDRVALIRSLRTLDRTAFFAPGLRCTVSCSSGFHSVGGFLPIVATPTWSGLAHVPGLAACHHVFHSVVVEFLEHLFDDRGLSPRTVLCYCAALTWPLQEAIQVGFEHADFRRQATGLFHLRLPPSSPLPQWDLTAVLRFYEAVDAHTAPIRMVFLKALFVTALATGNRCAEMAHFSRRALVDSGTTLTLWVMPRFLYKIQSSGHSPPPVVVPFFGGNPALCPVLALRSYLAKTASLPHNDFVFLHPVSAASLVAGRLNYWVVQTISAANVRGSVVRAHDVRKFAFSVNWTRRADLQHILSYGFWASAHPFLSHYLTSCQSVLPAFVAAGSVVAASSGV